MRDNKTDRELYTQNMLAKKAKREIRQTGVTNVRCPKCGAAPKVTITSGGERVIVSCGCGYIRDAEICFSDARRFEFLNN